MHITIIDCIMHSQFWSTRERERDTAVHHPGRAADGRKQAQHDADDRDTTAVRLRDAGHENMGILNVTVPSGPGIITKAAVSTRLARFAAAAEPSAMVTRHTVALLAVTSATPAGALAELGGF